MEKRGDGKPQHSAKFLRQRKFLMVLPVLVLPFLILLVWTLGLVGDTKAETGAAKKYQGLNLNLPSAAPAKDSNWNKLKYYEQADKDSMKLKSLLKNDPFRQLEPETVATGEDTKSRNGFTYSYDPYPSGKKTDHNEQRVYKKLAALNKELETAAERERQPKPLPNTMKKSVSLPSPDVDRLEKMMQTMQRKDEGEDPEMKQYNEMLEKILDIQNPERVQEKLRQQSEQHKRQVFAVETLREDMISVLEPKKDFSKLLARYKTDSIPEAMQSFMESNRFYSLDESTTEMTAHRAIAATIPENQTLVSGATLKLRLMEDIFIAGVQVPKDHFIYGLATLNGERLQVTISSVEYQDYILPVSLTVYDKKDGLPGIDIPGAITRDVAKKSAGQSMQGLSSINSLDPSIGAQALTAGLQAAQNIVSKSAKLVRVTVEVGYPVLLKDDNQQDK